MIIAEDIEQEALATLVVNKLRGSLKITAIKAPGSVSVRASTLKTLPSSPGYRRKGELGLTSTSAASKSSVAGAPRLGRSCTIVGAGDTAAEVAARVKQINRLVEVTERTTRRKSSTSVRRVSRVVLPSSKSVLKPKLNLRKRSFVLRMP